MEPIATSDRVLQIVGIAGSLRQESFNRGLLRGSVELAPATLRITVHDLLPIPVYNADVESQGIPEPVAALRDAVRTADGLLIATPEYNHGVPGVLKNAIDWLSRPPRASALNGKVAAIMGASPGMTGTGTKPDSTSTGLRLHQHVRTVAALRSSLRAPTRDSTPTDA